MARHVFFIDPIDKLNPPKDSTLMIAIRMKERGHQVSLLFEKDFYFENRWNTPRLTLYDFSGSFVKDSFYLEEFSLGQAEALELDPGDVVHMRLDPPFDSRYLRYLWMLDALKKYEVEIINDPQGIMINNEKLYAYQRKEDSLPTFVGSSLERFKEFANGLKSEGHEYLILKPLDLYQGIGVEKVSLDSNFDESFLKKVEEYQGPVIAQTYAKIVESGEIRTVFFKGKELGSILKVPLKGEYLANIAQGATYSSIDLSLKQKTICEQISADLERFNLPWLAFDLLGDNVSEVNITCPGLLVEVSEAVGANLADQIIDLL
jgi:glutathione synthase